MSAFYRLSPLPAAFCVLLAATPSLAAFHYKTHAADPVRDAQRHLADLGYYAGDLDGKMGAQTRAALKKFQHEHSMRPNGVLTANTKRALAKADTASLAAPRIDTNPKILGTHSFLTHETVTSSDQSANAMNPPQPDFAGSLNGGTKIVNSRFARVDVSESGNGSVKRYSINVNGQPQLIADGQPSVVSISPTYDLGDEDVVIFTTFSPAGGGCIYSNHVLAMNNIGSKMLNLDDCTKNYQAFAKNGTLFITFAQHDRGSAVGSTWRLEGMDLQKL